MAYTGIDKEIYESGTHFRPLQKYTQQQWTAPEIMGQNTNAGITATEVANPYKWPWPIPSGDGGAGDISGTQQRSWSPNQNLGPTNITDYEAEAYGVGPTWGGTWARAQDLYSKLPTPTNLLRRGWKGIQRWKEKRDIRREENLQEEIRAHNEAAGEKARVATVAQEIQQDIDRGGRGDRPDTGRNAPGAGPGQSPTGGNVAGTPFAQGGRIGYREGDPVIPEDENEDIYRFMQDQGIPFGERVEEVITDEEKAMVLDMLEKGMDMETIMSITGVGQEDIMSLMGGTSMAPEDQGLASLV